MKADFLRCDDGPSILKRSGRERTAASSVNPGYRSAFVQNEHFALGTHCDESRRRSATSSSRDCTGRIAMRAVVLEKFGRLDSLVCKPSGAASADQSLS